MSLLTLFVAITFLTSLSLVIYLNLMTVKKLLHSPLHVIILILVITGLGLSIAGAVMEGNMKPTQHLDKGIGIGLHPTSSGFLVSNTTHKFSIDSESLISALKQFAITKGLEQKTSPEDAFGRENLAQMLHLNSISIEDNKISLSIANNSKKKSDGPIVMAAGVALCAIGALMCATSCH